MFGSIKNDNFADKIIKEMDELTGSFIEKNSDNIKARFLRRAFLMYLYKKIRLKKWQKIAIIAKSGKKRL